MILSADWSIRRLQSWTCSSLSSSLPTVAEFVKLTQSIAIEIQQQFPDLYKVQLCNRQFFVGVHSDLRGKGIRVPPAWYYTDPCVTLNAHTAPVAFALRRVPHVVFLISLVLEQTSEDCIENTEHANINVNDEHNSK